MSDNCPEPESVVAEVSAIVAKLREDGFDFRRAWMFAGEKWGMARWRAARLAGYMMEQEGL